MGSQPPQQLPLLILQKQQPQLLITTTYLPPIYIKHISTLLLRPPSRLRHVVTTHVQDHPLTLTLLHHYRLQMRNPARHSVEDRREVVVKYLVLQLTL